jgi:hypothetical protein
LEAVAVDDAGNIETKSIIINIEGEEDITSEKLDNSNEIGINEEIRNQTKKMLSIYTPTSGETIEGVVPISFSVPIKYRKEGININVMAREVGGKKSSILSINGNEIPDSGLYKFPFNPEKKGEYLIYLYVIGDAKDFSSKVRINVK